MRKNSKKNTLTHFLYFIYFDIKYVLNNKLY